MGIKTADGKQNFKLASILFFSELSSLRGILLKRSALHAIRRFRMQSINTNTNNLFPPIPCNTIMFIYDNYDNKYDNTISYSCLLFKK
jgi:hypothetical protein